ncbi:SDR family oxidoreductase [Tomitella cavernea]|uniref:SDR family oxidoreductase n=1 Tax=Tomitella cavernea TaxID=1387982 RepID=A0ABP9D4A7_9ACTN|nr:SDR family oxidoreductase [Tomitella cavernea]
MKRYPPIELDRTLVAVTGGARGIGLATARAFHAAGAHVAIGDLDADLAGESATALGARVSGHALDVTDHASFVSFIEQAEAVHARSLAVLVNNAGIMPNAAFLDQDSNVDRTTMEINYFGMATGMRVVLPGMVERGVGHVVNVCSLVGRFPLQGLAGYNASKAAALALSESVRMELAGTGVSVSALLPSAVRTELASGIDFGWLPQVAPERIADAVVGTVRTRKAEIGVPGYLGALARSSAVMPESLARPFRRIIGDDAPLRKVDPAQRGAYLRRIHAPD